MWLLISNRRSSTQTGPPQPNGARTSRWRSCGTAPGTAASDQGAGALQVEPADRINRQDDAKLLWYLPGIHRQERAVRGARPLNQWPPGRASLPVAVAIASANGW